jgi:transcriptional regulator with XRE-family HTH domain
MPTRELPVDRGAERARTILTDLSREMRAARLDRGLSQAVTGRAFGLSGGQVSRIERGLVRELSINTAARLLAVLGLEISVRVFPAGEPVRDRAHLALLGRLRVRLHRRLAWRTEVAVPIPGDLRAWDATIGGTGWLIGVEAETPPRDVQALERRIHLKARDSGVTQVILLLANTRHNRMLLHTHGESLREAYPVAGARALELLRIGAEPGGNAIILL